MKLFTRYALLFLGSMALLQVSASEVRASGGLFVDPKASQEAFKQAVAAQNGEDNFGPVKPFSLDNAELTRRGLQAEQRVRTGCHVIAGAAVLAGGAYAGYRAYKSVQQYYDTKVKEEERKKNMDPRITTLEERVAALALQANQTAVDNQEVKTTSSLTWRNWFLEKAKWVGKGTQGLVGALVFGEVARQATGVVSYQLPSVADYLFKGRTLAWFIEQKAKGAFVAAVRDIGQWVDVFESRTGAPNELERLTVASKIKAFTQEVEKVVGYMMFVKGRLNKYQVLEAARADECIEDIARECKQLAEDVNNFITGKKKIDRVTMGINLRGRVLAILILIENFELVQLAAGYIDLDPSTVLNSLKTLINPREKEFLRQIQEQQARNMVLQTQAYHYEKMADVLARIQNHMVETMNLVPAPGQF